MARDMQRQTPCSAASHIFVHSPQEDQQRVIRFYGEHVLPNVARAVRR